MRNSRTFIRSCALLACATLARLAMADGPSQRPLPAPADAKLVFANTPSAPPAPAHAAENLSPLAMGAGAGDSFFKGPSAGNPTYAAAAPVAPAAAPAAVAEESAPADNQPLLTGLLMKTPIGPALQDARINVFGWIQTSYEYNANVRDGSPNNGRNLDQFQNNRGYLNQLDLSLERTVDLTSKSFDVGGRIDLNYGSDARSAVSSDLFDHGSFSQEARFDIHQLYFDFLVPVGDGVRVRVGKFEFFKTLDPNGTPLYSHPIEFGEAFPYTLTGISALTALSKQWTVEGGISRGWNQTLTDNNGAAIDGFARVRWDINDVSLLSVAVITGPEQFRDSTHFTTATDVNYQYFGIEKLILIFDATLSHQAAAVLGDAPGSNVPGPGFPVGSGSASWYGLNAVGIYKINDFVSAAGRFEWFRDEEGYILDVLSGNTHTAADREGVNLYAITFALNLKPFHATPVGDSFILRPEMRYDYASRDFFHLNKVGVGDRHDQLTLAISAIFNF